MDRRTSLLLAGLVAFVYAVVGLAVPVATASTQPVSVRTAAGVPVVAGFLLGPAGAAGTVLGELVVSAVRGGSPSTAFYRVLGVGTAAVVAHECRGTGVLPARSRFGTPVRRLLTYGVAAVPAVLAMTAVVAAGWSLAGVAPFYLTVVALMPGALLSALLVGPPVVYLAWRFGAETSPRAPRARSGRSAVAIGAVSLAWLALGSAASLASRSLRFVPDLTLRRRWYLRLVDGVFGTGGILIQAAIAVVAAYVLVRLLTSSRQE